MLKLVRSSFLPNVVMLFHGTGQAGKDVEKIVPVLAGQVAIDGKATAYVCENYVCKRPVNSTDELKSLLQEITKKHKSKK